MDWCSITKNTLKVAIHICGAKWCRIVHNKNEKFATCGSKSQIGVKDHSSKCPGLGTCSGIDTFTLLKICERKRNRNYTRENRDIEHQAVFNEGKFTFYCGLRNIARTVKKGSTCVGGVRAKPVQTRAVLRKDEKELFSKNSGRARARARHDPSKNLFEAALARFTRGDVIY